MRREGLRAPLPTVDALGQVISSPPFPAFLSEKDKTDQSN